MAGAPAGAGGTTERTGQIAGGGSMNAPPTTAPNAAAGAEAFGGMSGSVAGRASTDAAGASGTGAVGGSAGESGGILDVILQRLSGYIEKAVKLTAKVKGAMTYPIAVITIALTVVIVIMVKVIPVFSAMYEGLGSKLPFPTQVCIAISNAIINYSWLLIIVGALLVVGIRQYYKTPIGKVQIDGLLLKIPILGDVLRKVAVARFCRTLGTLISSGVPILEGMDITARTAGNMVIQNAILKSKDAVEQGRNIATPLAETKVFPPMVVQMVGVGEATGALDAMLSKVADFYEDEVDNAVANLTSLMEPVMIAMLGGIIGFIVIAMYLPIFNLANVFGKD